MIEPLLRIDVALFVLIGVFGGAHCIGMCGPLVTMYSEQMTPRPDGGTAARSRRASRTPHDLRGPTTLPVQRRPGDDVRPFGTLFGALGSVVFVTADQLTPVADLLRGTVGLAVGGFIVLTGVRYVIGGSGGDIRIPGVQRVTSWLAARVHRHVNSPSVVGLGGRSCVTSMPDAVPRVPVRLRERLSDDGRDRPRCFGSRYDSGRVPLRNGHPVHRRTHRRRVHRLLGVVFVVLGYVLVAHGLMALGVHIPHPMFPHYQPLGGGMGH